MQADTPTQVGSPWRRRRLLPRSTRGMLLFILLVVIVPVLLVETGTYLVRFDQRRAEELRANLELARSEAANFEAYVRDVLLQELAIGLALTVLPPSTAEQRNQFLAETASASLPSTSVPA